MIAVQKFLPLRAELRLPTVDLAGARAILDLHENEIKTLIDVGDLPAWNIATKENETRCERRILTIAARDWADGKKRQYEEEEIIKRIYGRSPAGRSGEDFIFGKDFYRAWNCDSGHMINLLRDGSLSKLDKTDWRRGRNGTPCITWLSAIAFLKARRIES